MLTGCAVSLVICRFRGMGPHARVFRAHFGGGPQRGPGGAAASDTQRIMFTVMQFLPIILLVLFSLFAGERLNAIGG
jgi:hypothetical protein